jgi:flagellar biosynthesis anti-sigma factor FlgM
MKIDSNYPNFEVDSISPRNTSQPGETSGRSENTRATDTEKTSPDTVVNLSRASREAQLIKDTIDKTQDIRQEKVDQLKQDISNNEYRINLQAIASKVLSHFTNDFFSF